MDNEEEENKTKEDEIKVRKVEHFLFNTCACTPEEAIEVLNVCMRNARGKMYGLTFRKGRLQPNSSRYDPNYQKKE